MYNGFMKTIVGPMKVFVTGGAGYVGSVAVKELLDRGHEVLVFDDLRTGHREAIDSRATFCNGGLEPNDRWGCSLYDSMREFEPDAVMHFAASALVGMSMEHPMDYFMNNVANGVSLLFAMQSCGCNRLVFSSSCATYGSPHGSPAVERISELTPQIPTSPYGESKLMFERMIKWQARLKGLRPTTFRYFNASGSAGALGEDHNPETHLIPNTLKVALGRKKHVEVFGTKRPTLDGTCVRDYVHVSDLAVAHARALECDVLGEYNLGIGRGYSVKEVISACCRATGVDIPAVEREDRPGDPDVLIANSDLASDAGIWDPKFRDIDTIVASAWAWHKANPEGYRSSEPVPF